MDADKVNPEWGFMEEIAAAALVPHGRRVPLRECHPGPYILDGHVCWMSEYGQKSYNQAGENCVTDLDTMVQPLEVVTHSAD